MLPAGVLSSYQKIIVEVGMGDGRVLERLALMHPEALCIGIDIDPSICAEVRKRIVASNVQILAGAAEDLIPSLPDSFVHLFTAVLPDPMFIDRESERKWVQFYSDLLSKLRPGGRLQLITELTDDLLQPVSESDYESWTAWLGETFSKIGFVLQEIIAGSPADFSSRCLDQFRADPERIRIVTLNLRKQLGSESKPAL